MKIKMSLVRFTVAAIVVMVLGGLAGWYLFVRGQISSTEMQDSARGFGAEDTFGGSLGSGLSNIVSGIIGNVVGNNETASVRAPKLWQVTRTPVAGLGFASSTPELYFAERASGNILIANPLETKVERLTNTLVPKVIEARFAHDGSVVLRAVSEDGEAVTFAANISTSTSPAAGDTPNKLEGVFLPPHIVDIAARESNKELFFVIKDDIGAAAVTSDWLGTNQKRIVSSALSGWKTFFLADGGKYLVQRASDDVNGTAFRVTSSGSLERIIGNLPGLMLLPKSGSSAFAYSTSVNGVVSLFARPSSSASDAALAVRTIAEKCVWGPETRPALYCAVPQTTPSGNFIREWYDGSAHTADAWWRIDISSNAAEQIFTPDPGISIDVEQPQIDASGRYLAFMNRSDKTLWMLSLEN